MVTNPQEEHIHERVLASTLMTMTAGKTASVIDSFLSWFVAGAGAAIALLAGNLSGLSPYISVQSVKCAATLFLVAAVITVVEKFLAAIVIGAAESANHAGEIAERMLKNDIELDMRVVFREFELATFPPLRWLIKRSFAKTEAGNFTGPSRKLAKCAQIQVYLALVATAFITWAMIVVVRGLGG